MKPYKSEFLQILEYQTALHKRKAPFEDFLATVLCQCEVGFSSLVKIKRKYRNRMDVRPVFSVQIQA